MVFLPESPLPPTPDPRVRPAPVPRPRPVPPTTPKPTAAESAAGVTRDDIERARRLKLRNHPGTRFPGGGGYRKRRLPPTQASPMPTLPSPVETQKAAIEELPNPYAV
jgi:hypothetical protein